MEQKKAGKLLLLVYSESISKTNANVSKTAKSICGSFVGNLEETKEMLELVKSGKVDPIPVETEDLKEATKTLDDLRKGNITGRVVLEP